MRRPKLLHKLTPVQNANFIATPEGQLAYDLEMRRLKQNRDYFAAYKKAQIVEAAKKAQKKEIY